MAISAPEAASAAARAAGLTGRDACWDAHCDCGGDVALAAIAIALSVLVTTSAGAAVVLVANVVDKSLDRRQSVVHD